MLFRSWEQLESADYRVYVANLRKVGCPEQTIRDIIIADVHSLYAPRYLAIQVKQAAFGTSQMGAQSGSEQTSEADSKRLRDDEESVLATLLGSQSGELLSADSMPEASSPPRPLRRDTVGQAVSMPLVFQRVDPALRLDRAQTEILDDLRQRFVEEIGGPNQNPNDPAYLERWKAAQSKSDDLLQTFLGGEFFVNYQFLAADEPVLMQ